MHSLERSILSNLSEHDDVLAFIETTAQSIHDVQTKLNKLREFVINLNDKIQDLETRSQALKSERAALASEKDTLAGELRKKATDYDALLKQFESISSEFRSIRDKEETTLDVRQLLSLYVALLEDIYAARPHIRILWLLHGAKGAAGMTRQEINLASGYEPAAVLAAIHDLANAGFLGYNIETQLITLERRIFT